MTRESSLLVMRPISTAALMVWASSLLDSFVTEELAEFDQRGGIAGHAVFVIGQPAKELPARGIGPALHHAFVGFVEGVLQVQQGNHHAQRHAGAACVGNTATHHWCFAEQVQIGHGHRGACFAHEEVGDRGFNLLPGHA